MGISPDSLEFNYLETYCNTWDSRSLHHTYIENISRVVLFRKPNKRHSITIMSAIVPRGDISCQSLYSYIDAVFSQNGTTIVTQ